MKKEREYEVGDIIKIGKEKFAPIETRITGAKVTVEFLSQIIGQAHEELWALIRREYPDVYRKYQLSYSDGELRIGTRTKKEDKSGQ